MHVVGHILTSVGSMLSKIIDYLEKLLTFAMGGLCLALISVLCVEVVNRYFFGIPAPWVQYFIPLSFLWMCMLGTAVAVRRSEHFEVDLLRNLLRGRPEQIHRTLVHASTFIGGALIVWASVGFVQLGVLKSSPATGTSMVYIYASILVGGALIMLFALDRLVMTNRTEKPTNTTGSDIQ